MWCPSKAVGLGLYQHITLKPTFMRIIAKLDYIPLATGEDYRSDAYVKGGGRRRLTLTTRADQVPRSAIHSEHIIAWLLLLSRRRSIRRRRILVL